MFSPNMLGATQLAAFFSNRSTSPQDEQNPISQSVVSTNENDVSAQQDLAVMVQGQPVVKLPESLLVQYW